MFRFFFYFLLRYIFIYVCFLLYSLQSSAAFLYFFFKTISLSSILLFFNHFMNVKTIGFQYKFQQKPSLNCFNESLLSSRFKLLPFSFCGFSFVHKISKLKPKKKKNRKKKKSYKNKQENKTNKQTKAFKKPIRGRKVQFQKDFVFVKLIGNSHNWFFMIPLPCILIFREKYIKKGGKGKRGKGKRGE